MASLALPANANRRATIPYSIEENQRLRNLLMKCVSRFSPASQSQNRTHLRRLLHPPEQSAGILRQDRVPRISASFGITSGWRREGKKDVDICIGYAPSLHKILGRARQL